MSQARRQPGPFVGDQRQQKSTAARSAQHPRRRQQLLDCQIVPLKIDAREPVHLQVHPRWRDPLIIRDRLGCSSQVGDDAVAPLQSNPLAGRVVARADFASLHGIISVCRSRVGKQNILVIPHLESQFQQKIIPMKVEFYGHVRQYRTVQKEIDANLEQVLLSGQYVMGPMLKRFEEELARFHGTKYGDGVITHPNTFFATAEAIWIAGATAVFIDCDRRTKCIDPARIEAAITSRTKAIVPVHLYGQCADMKSIRKIAGQHKLSVVEDNAQAIGARGDGFKVGELSDAAATSFIIQKNLGTFGDSGALVTNNEKIDTTVRKLRNHGSNARNVHSFGFNSRLDDLHAGVLSAKLKHIDAWNDLRRKWSARYTAGLKGAKNFTLPSERQGYRHVFHLYIIETKKPEQRDPFLKFLNDNA